jgi:hypothetical protein
MAKIITKSNSDEIVGWITKFLSSSPSTLVARFSQIEG